MRNDIISALTNYGYLDINRCNEVLDEADIADVDFVVYLRDLFPESIQDIDLVAWVYDYILDKVRDEISQATEKDILNDLSENIHVAGNYCATSYDYTDKAKKETLELALQVKEPSKTLQWFINQIQ